MPRKKRSKKAPKTIGEKPAIDPLGLLLVPSLHCILSQTSSALLLTPSVTTEGALATSSMLVNKSIG